VTTQPDNLATTELQGLVSSMSARNASVIGVVRAGQALSGLTAAEFAACAGMHRAVSA
jgi:hypothetical protein